MEITESMQVLLSDPELNLFILSQDKGTIITILDYGKDKPCTGTVVLIGLNIRAQPSTLSRIKRAYKFKNQVSWSHVVRIERPDEAVQTWANVGTEAEPSWIALRTEDQDYILQDPLPSGKPAKFSISSYPANNTQ